MNPIKKRGIVISNILFCIVLAGIFLLLFQSKEENNPDTTGYELASTIRLMKIEGEVLVQNAVGNTISNNVKMKLYNGYQITTSKESYAWITLDDTKVIKIDANSVVEVQKKNEKITLYVDAGNVFFNVKQPLKIKENFHVKTSTMTMGIRGTSGVVTALKNGKSEIRLFTGKVYVYVEEAVNAQNTTKFLMSGNILECTAFDQEKKVKTKIITMKEEDIPSFAAAEIVEDNQLRNRIQKETNLNVSSLTVEDISSIQQMEEDSTKENQEKSKEEGQSQVTERVTTDESEAGNRNIEETILYHSFYDWSTSSNSSYKETAINKNILNESNKNTESHRKEEDNQEQKDSQRKKQPSKEETNASSEKQHEKGSTSTSENQLEEEITSTSGSRSEEGTPVTPENQPEEGTTSAPEKQPEEGTTSVSEQQQTEEGSTTGSNKQPSEEGTTSSTSSENNATENTMEENTSSTIEESTEEITSSPDTSTDNVEEGSSDETPENSNRPSWWEEILGEIWDTIKNNLFPNYKE